jgi:hypothetical protein
LPDAPADCRAQRQPTPNHDRRHRAERLRVVAQAQHSGQSQHGAAASAGVARGTLRHWSAGKVSGAAPALVAFSETPEGVQWLRQILVAAHWCITELGGAGIRVVDEFLELSGLSAFIGASYGTQQAFHAELERQILACASEQRAALAKAMPHRTLSVAEDETWKDGMRLVAIDPVTGFLLVEQVAEERSAAAWTQALEHGLARLNVTVEQGTSDEAKGLLAHVQRDLGAHHSADLFHLQHEVSKATSLSLARAQQQAEAEEAQAITLGHLPQAQPRNAADPHHPRRSPPACLHGR